MKYMMICPKNKKELCANPNYFMVCKHAHPHKLEPETERTGCGITGLCPECISDYDRPINPAPTGETGRK